MGEVVLVLSCGLWVLIVVVVEWVATLRGFKFFFFFFWLFDCGFYLILAC